MGVRLATTWRGSALAVLLIAVALGGCIAGDVPEQTLSAADGNGELVIVAELADGSLRAADAYWEVERPAPRLELDSLVLDWEARILKNNVLLDRVPLMGTPERAFVVWRSGDSETAATAGDTFELFLVDLASDETLASFKVEIAA